MKVLLIDPPHDRFFGFYRFYYPIGLAYIGAVLNKDGHEVKTLDCEHFPEGKSYSFLDVSQMQDLYHQGLQDDYHPVWTEIRGVVEDFLPDIIGISTLSPKIDSALKISAIIKQTDLGIPIVFGGEHATHCYQELGKENVVDYFVVGEGEYTMKDLVNYLSSGNKSPPNIKGLVHRTSNGMNKLIHRELIRDLDKLPFPARHLLSKPETYRSLDMGLIMGSRGCFYGCTYCGIAPLLGSRVRYRSVSNIVQEIRRTHKAYGTTFFSFRDASFTASKKRVINFCKEVENLDFDIKWECLTRLDLIDEEMVEYMQDANCNQFRVGIESGSQRILDYLKRDITIEKIERVAEILNKKHAYWSAYFMFGTPEETTDDINKTLQFIEKIQPSFITLSRYVPLPGTELYREIIRTSPSLKINWKNQDNRCVDECYSRHIEPKHFKKIMNDVARFALSYNRQHSDGTMKRDLRLVSDFEDTREDL